MQFKSLSEARIIAILLTTTVYIMLLIYNRVNIYLSIVVLFIFPYLFYNLYFMIGNYDVYVLSKKSISIKNELISVLIYGGWAYSFSFYFIYRLINKKY